MGRTTLQVKCALVVKGAFDRSIVSSFEAATGDRLEIDWAPTTVIATRLAAGDTADAVLVVGAAMDRLIEDGTADAAGRVEVVASSIGLAVRAGAAHPDIATVQGLKQALLDARSVCYSTGGASGLYFAPLLGRLGIAEAVNRRATLVAQGFTAEKLVSGEADLAVQQISELMVVPGIEVAGPLPDEVQHVTSFSAAPLRGTANSEAVALFLAFLGSATAHAAYRASGLQPVGEATAGGTG